MNGARAGSPRIGPLGNRQDAKPPGLGRSGKNPSASSWSSGQRRIPPVFPRRLGALAFHLLVRRSPLWVAMGACLLLVCAAIAAEPGAPPLPPQPRLSPALPSASEPGGGDPTDLLLRRIDAAIRSRDQAIAGLGAGHGANSQPIAPGRGAMHEVAELPEIIAAKGGRDVARDALRAALAEFAGRATRHSTDPLDLGRPAVTARQAPVLAAANRLAIAECCRDLAAAGGEHAASDLADGLAALERIEDLGLDRADRPKVAYLRLWFQAEQARRAEPAAQAAAVAAVRAAIAAFVQTWPTSDLGPAAQAIAGALP